MVKKGHKKKTARKSVKQKPKQSPSSVTVIYAVLAVLVIGTSFYTGYLVGQSSGGVTKTGSSGVDKLTIIEYSDFQCPFCSRAAPTVKQIEQAYGDKVDIVYKHFPLESIHPDAFNAAVASECVRKQGGDEAFWKFHDALFANQQALDAASLKSYASQLGVSIDSCLDNQETADKVRADMAEARQRGVSGTPSFWVHDELMVGALPFESFKAKIDEKLGGVAAPAPAPAPQAPPQPTGPVDVAEGNYILGDKNAPVTLIEFTDYQCPFCGRAHTQSYPQIYDEYFKTGKVKYTVRHFPLTIHPDAQKASEAAECAGKVGGAEKFWEYHNVLFENQQSLGVPNLKTLASNLGLDTGAFNTCLDSGEFEQLVKDDMAAGLEVGVRGTPSFFVNGNNIAGAQPFSAFKAAIDSELQ